MTLCVARGPMTDDKKHSSILPPSKLRIGNRFKIPSTNDAQEKRRADAQTPHRGAATAERTRLTRGPAAHRSHSSE